MKAGLLLIGLLLAPLSLLAEDEPTVDLFAGWAWSPFAYGHPYYPYGPWWCDDDPRPAIGPAHAWPYPGGPWLYPYSYGCALPMCGWGYDYGVRLRLTPGSPALLPGPSNALLHPLPGSAPAELRDETRERAWDRDIESLLATLPTDSALPHAATNAPAR